MRIIITGAGIVGHSLTEFLMDENHTVSVIERDRAVCNMIQEKLDVMVICGTAISPTILEESGIEDADMVIAVTPDDAKNILVCGLAKQFGVKRRIARIRSVEYLMNDSVCLSDLGVTDVIDPEQVMVKSIINRLETPKALDATNFQDDTLLMRSYIINENMEVCGKTLSSIRRLTGTAPFLIVAVIRDKKSVVPHGDFQLKANDEIITFFPRESINLVSELLNIPKPKNKKVIISGDNLLAVQLAGKLEEIFDTVILVDENLNHCKKAADLLINTEVMHGDCTDPDLLNELMIDNSDFFIAVSNETEHNMMSSLLAKTLGVPEVICISNEVKHDNLLYSIGIDYVINPRLTISREILEKVMQGHIGAAVRIRNVNLEVIRYKVDENSLVTKKKLSELWKEFRSEAIVGGIIRDKKMLIPTGETQIKADDYVIILSLHNSIEKVNSLFKEHKSLATKIKEICVGE